MKENMQQEMSAQEMFEKLGYTRENSNDTITYRYYTYDKKSYVREVDFFLSIKEYFAIQPLGGLFIDVELHKAINKQIEELGWLEK